MKRVVFISKRRTEEVEYQLTTWAKVLEHHWPKEDITRAMVVRLEFRLEGIKCSW
jgi:hypothetical protein